MKNPRFALVCAVAVAFVARAQAAESPLRIVMIDAEGGAASLFVTPEGKSLLVDTGWARDTLPGSPASKGGPTAARPAGTGERIAAAARRLGLKRIDYVLITHYHADHVGGVRELLAGIPVGTFIDHGPNRETLTPKEAADPWPGYPERTYPRYLAAIAGHPRITAKVGAKLRIGSLTLTIVSSDGALIGKPLAGAGGPGRHCAVPDKPPRAFGEEDNRSLGFVATYGNSRILDLGDLLWNKEKRLVCPLNELGRVDLLLVSSHGADQSTSAALIESVAARVALMANGAHKGGDASVFETLARAEPKPVLWQEHAAMATPAVNRPNDYIANLADQPDAGHELDVLVYEDGRMTVTNTRNGYIERYSAH